MRQRLLVLAYLALFWLLFIMVMRAVFILYNHDLAAQLNGQEIALVFLHGFKMDLSMAGYYVMAAALVLTLSNFSSARWPHRALDALNIVLIVLSAFLAVVDLELYRHWGFRLNTAPLFYLQTAGSEAVGSVEPWVVVRLLILWVILSAISVVAYRRMVTPKLTELRRGTFARFAVLLGVTGLMVIPIRGSLSVAPMNTGFVYFHKSNAFANHAAINVIWNFLYNLESSHTRTTYPEDLVPRPTAEKHFRLLYPADDSTAVRLWRVEKPNIIFFILESFTANVVEALGGSPGVTPNLNALCEEGVLFTNFYSSGDRTDKGLISILSGYPAQPVTSIIKNTAKTQRLPYLNHNMKDLGYHTSFVYGGDIDFANFRSYLTNSGFDHVTSDEDFTSEYNESKWGVHDHIVFDRAFQECDTASHPFFKVILSLSSHEPFDVPMTPRFPGRDGDNLVKNSCFYTDQSLGDFIAKAKASHWWDSTVVVVVADHGHRFPGNVALQEKERYRIPLLIAGGAVAERMRVEKFGSQTDIANTLLAQFAKPSDAFSFSKNLLSPASRPFAAYFFNDGFGFVAPGQYIIYDNVGQQFLRNDGADAEALERAKAYAQMLFMDYNRR